jgi:hypothetical protein
VQRGDRSSVIESLAANIAAGRSFDDRFVRGVVSGAVSTSGDALLPISLSGSYGRASEGTPLFERFSIGGLASPLIDRALLAQRFTMPALPAGIGINSSAFSYRVAADARPVSFYLYSASTAPAGHRFVAWNRVVGADWSLSVPAIPLAGTPAARAQIGVGESLDAPFRKHVRAYVSVVLDP